MFKIVTLALALSTIATASFAGVVRNEQTATAKKTIVQQYDTHGDIVMHPGDNSMDRWSRDNNY